MIDKMFCCGVKQWGKKNEKNNVCVCIPVLLIYHIRTDTNNRKGDK